MKIVSRKSETKGSCVLKKIRVEGNVDEGQEVIVSYETETLECEGFQSFMARWTKLYGRV